MFRYKLHRARPSREASPRLKHLPERPLTARSDDDVIIQRRFRDQRHGVRRFPSSRRFGGRRRDRGGHFSRRASVPLARCAARLSALARAFATLCARWTARRARRVRHERCAHARALTRDARARVMGRARDGRAATGGPHLNARRGRDARTTRSGTRAMKGGSDVYRWCRFYRRPRPPALPLPLPPPPRPPLPPPERLRERFCARRSLS